MAQSLQPQDVEGSCCQEKSTRLVTFDCGDGTTQTFLVCNSHYQEEAWSRFAIKVVELRK